MEKEAELKDIVGEMEREKRNLRQIENIINTLLAMETTATPTTTATTTTTGAAAEEQLSSSFFD